MSLKRVKTILLIMLMVFVVSATIGISGAERPAYAASFKIDDHFIQNALKDAQMTEPGYIQGNDCTHWISWFLQTAYHMPARLASNITDPLVNNLLRDGDAKVITSDRKYDLGGFIPVSQAGQVIDGLDSHLLENGGHAEYIIAYRWKDSSSGALTDHLAVYVGNGRMVSHSVTYGQNDAGGYNRVPRPWNVFDNLDSIAILQLTVVPH